MVADASCVLWEGVRETWTLARQRDAIGGVRVRTPPTRAGWHLARTRSFLVAMLVATMISFLLSPLSSLHARSISTLHFHPALGHDAIVISLRLFDAKASVGTPPAGGTRHQMVHRPHLTCLKLIGPEQVSHKQGHPALTPKPWDLVCSFAHRR